ncbi:uncharacterized protein LOC129944499 [Eupeodes corollae]|uniref:uncharacterized protein LOC129944499 n=1 Tax=Eupeodes corollae TaxID=290404 RepID=UPI00249249CD|nr:uncharacterized protein LOC129944499 [Eupeodes corollae]
MTMKTFIAFSALLAVASASVSYYAPAGLVIPATKHQYHAQDEFGQYAFGYSEPLSAKQEVKTLDGVTRGSYSYTDSDGIIQTVDYTADEGGFRVAATNLPKPVEAPEVPPQDIPKQVEDTPEVAAAKSAHLAAVEEAKLRNGDQEPAPAPVTAAPVELPRQVEDTPEVAQAKAEHLNAVEEAKLRNAAIEKIDNELSIIRNTPLLAPLQLAYRSLLPNQFSYTYGLSGALPLLSNTHYVTSHVIH